jgi:maltose O-acetyltransferase
MTEMRSFLEKIDEYIYTFLVNNVEAMPIRFIKIIANYYPDARIRKLYFGKLGVKMGNNTFANLGMKIVVNQDNQEPQVIIGNNVSIAPNVVFVVDSGANNGDIINSLQYIKDHLTVSAKIIIEDEVWIGTNVTILPGVTVGRCSIIGAGSVVTKNTDSYSIYAGVPARKIKSLEKS